jgi:hypothetical protein
VYTGDVNQPGNTDSAVANACAGDSLANDAKDGPTDGGAAVVA